MDRMALKSKKQKAACDASFSYFKKGHPVITMHGSSHICIENYRRLLAVSCDEIRLSTALGPLVVWGNRLTILCFSSEEISISGQIRGLRYVREDAQ